MRSGVPSPRRWSGRPEFEEAERARDAEALLAFLAPDFYMYQDGLRFDRDAIEAQVRGTMPTLQRFETEFSDIEVRVLGRNSAVVSLTFRDRVTDASGATTRQRGVTTFVWERRGEVWLITYADADHFPDTVPQDTVP